MRNKKVTQSIILVVLLLITFFLANITPETVETNKRIDLKKVLGPIEGYEITSRSPLDEDTTRFLELDDYTSIGYKKDNANIGLYIGYYFSLDKVSAAHSPLVCFPGQGWAISQPLEGSLEVDGQTIHYSEMVATLEGNKELVLFWYQAYEKTAPATFRNKINAMINMLTGKKQEHAFVRVTVPFIDSEEAQARQEAMKFIQAFYPTFLSYINS